MDPNAITALESFGFSSYEARAYLALQRAAPVTGYQLSKNAGIPRSRIYDTIERLLEKGYAIRIEGDPATYAALSPAGLMNRIRTGVKQSLQAIEAYVGDPDQGETFLHIRTEEAVMDWIDQVIRSANRFLAMTSDSPLSERQLAAIKAVRARGVSCILHTPNAPGISGAQHFLRRSPLRSPGGHPGLFHLLVDGESVLTGNSDRATWSRSPEMLGSVEEAIRLRITQEEIVRRIGSRAEHVLMEIDRVFSKAVQPAAAAKRPPAGMSLRPTLRPFPGIRTSEAIIEPAR